LENQAVTIKKFNIGKDALMKSAVLIGGLLALSQLALAQSASQSTPQNKTGPDVQQDDSLTWHGITLYGVVDIGLQYDNHGAPFNDYHPAGSANIVQKNSRQSVFGATPSNMGQSRVGLQGAEPLPLPFAGDWSAVFRLETFFNPQSGDISDAERSLVQNNGKTPATSGMNLDSSVAGEAFETAYAGVSSKAYGTLTFGRQLTLLGDGVNKYDPNYGSQAFSLIGMSGGYAGGGYTEDKRVDNALKYYGTFADIFHVGALFKLNNASGSGNTGRQLELGAEYAGASIDAYYSKFDSAVSAATLSAAQVAELPTLGYSVNNTLAGTISDNTAYALMSSYKWQEFKFFLSLEHIQFANPSQPLTAGFQDIGGYVIGFVNDDAYVHPKIYNVAWAGVRYTVVPALDLTAAYYYVHQSAYGTGKDAGCDSTLAGSCAGNLEALSFDADYTLNKHFDAYIGAMYSAVHNGLANGYAFQTNNLNPTVGVRFKF